jgi:hypothetical protein
VNSGEDKGNWSAAERKRTPSFQAHGLNFSRI